MLLWTLLYPLKNESCKYLYVNMYSSHSFFLMGTYYSIIWMFDQFSIEEHLGQLY